MADGSTTRRNLLGGAGGMLSAISAGAAVGQAGPATAQGTLDAAGISFTQVAPRAARRSAAAKLSEVLTAKDFGAVGDGSRDDSVALEAWFEAGLKGRSIHLPAGRYRLSRPLIGKIADGNRDGFRLGIIGDGAANTEIFFEGDPDQTALTIIGNMPQFDQLQLCGLRVTRPDRGAPGLGIGAALHLENIRNFRLEDVRTFRSGIGLRLSGCLVGRVTDFLSYYDRKGMVLERGRYLSTPNAISLEACSILASFEVGVQLSQPSLVRMGNGSTIEGIGTENAGGDAIGLLIEDAGHAGGVGFLGDGIYFENNCGDDVRIRHGEKPATYALRSCTFNRVGQSRTRNGIVVESSNSDSQAVLDVRGSAFMGYENYSPSSDTPYLRFAPGVLQTSFQFLDEGTIYHHREERPRLPSPGHKQELLAFGALVRSDGSMERVRGVVSAHWLQDGLCEIRLAEPTPGLLINLTAYDRPVQLTIVSEKPSVISIGVRDANTGNPARGAFLVTGFHA